MHPPSDEPRRAAILRRPIERGNNALRWSGTQNESTRLVSVETMVEYMVELLAGGLRSAATLDLTLDVVVAIGTLLEDQ